MQSSGAPQVILMVVSLGCGSPEDQYGEWKGQQAVICAGGCTACARWSVVPGCFQVPSSSLSLSLSLSLSVSLSLWAILIASRSRCLKAWGEQDQLELNLPDHRSTSRWYYPSAGAFACCAACAAGSCGLCSISSHLWHGQAISLMQLALDDGLLDNLKFPLEPFCSPSQTPRMPASCEPCKVCRHRCGSGSTRQLHHPAVR